MLIRSGNLNNAMRAVMAAVRAGISDFMLTVLDDPDAASARTTLGAAAATAALSSLQALTPAADKLPYFSSDSSASLAAFTSIARTLLAAANANAARDARSEEHTSELQSLMRIPYAVFCLKKTKKERTFE